jgi:hypothetical protein
VMKARAMPTKITMKTPPAIHVHQTLFESCKCYVVIYRLEKLAINENANLRHI